MPINDRPYIKFTESKTLNKDINSKNSFEFQESEKNNELIVFIDAIHAMTTSNYTTYTPTELRGDAEEKTGVHSWNYPYDKPVLTHHEQHSGEPIGRVIRADFKNKSSINGKPCNRLKVKLTDPKAIDKVKDGRYSTVSIGGRAEKAHCSICGQDVLNEGHCGHWPGRTYEEETCHVILGNISFVEVSFVNVPADSYAMVVHIDDSQASKKDNTKESFMDSFLESNAINNQGGTSMPDKEFKKLKEDYSLALDKLAIKEELAESLGTKNSRLQESNKELVEENKLAKENLKEAKRKVKSLESDIEEMEEELIELRTIKHNGLAEKVVSMKVEMGHLVDDDEDFVKEMVEKYSSRSTESLKDTLEDLKMEKGFLQKDTAEDSTQESVKNPGLHNSKESQVKNADGETKVSNEEEVNEKLKKLNII